MKIKSVFLGFVAMLAFGTFAEAKIKIDKDGHYLAYCKGQASPFGTYLTQAAALNAINEECPAGGIISYNGIKEAVQKR